MRLSIRRAAQSGARVRRAGWIIALLLLPLVLQALGTHWVRVADTCLLYVMLALGLNIVVGQAGLLDLGYVAFYAVGAYLAALLSSPHLVQQFAWVAAQAPAGLHSPWWITLPLAALLAGLMGALLGTPTLKLRGDYLAIVTLGFGEIIRILINNGGAEAFNLTDGAKGLGHIDAIRIFGLDLGTPLVLGILELPPVTLHYFLFLALTSLFVVLCQRLQASRVGRAWAAIREDEMAAASMGIPTRSLKLMAFAMGASLGGVAGALFAHFQGFISPEAFSLQESVMVVAMVVFGGMGHIGGVILGAIALTAIPELLRYVVNPLQAWTDGRIDAGVLRQLLVALAMILTMRWRPHGLWPAPEQPKDRPTPR